MRESSDGRICAMALTAALVVSTQAAAEVEYFATCNTGEGGSDKFDVSLFEPRNVLCTDPTDEQIKECTQFDYWVGGTGRVKRVAALLPLDVQLSLETLEAAGDVGGPCEGTRVNTADFGEYDCTHQTVRFDGPPRPSKDVSITVVGRFGPTPGSILVGGLGGGEGPGANWKGGGGYHPGGPVIGSCAIPVPGGSAFDPFQQAPTEVVAQFRSCPPVAIGIGPDGEGTTASFMSEETPCRFLTAPSEDGMSSDGQPVGSSKLVIDVNGEPIELENSEFGDGELASGTGSCTTRIIRRKIYTWCTCSDDTDPSPPCTSSEP